MSSEEIKLPSISIHRLLAFHPYCFHVTHHICLGIRSPWTRLLSAGLQQARCQVRSQAIRSAEGVHPTPAQEGSVSPLCSNTRETHRRSGAMLRGNRLDVRVSEGLSESTGCRCLVSTLHKGSTAKIRSKANNRFWLPDQLSDLPKVTVVLVGESRKMATKTTGR